MPGLFLFIPIISSNILYKLSYVSSDFLYLFRYNELNIKNNIIITIIMKNSLNIIIVDIN